MPQFSDSNRARLSFSEEAAWGETPAGPAMTKLPFTGESLKGNIKTVTSNTIRDDRNIANMAVVGGGAGGDISFEFVYGDYDEFIKGALQSTFAVTSAVGTSMSFTTSGRVTSTGADFSAISVGQFIKIANASTTANDGLYRVIAAASASITCAIPATASTANFTAETFNADTSLNGKMIRNGVTNRSYLIEKYFSDIGEFFQYSGMRVGGMGIAFGTQDILTGSFSFLGKSQVGASATVASTLAESTGNQLFNTSDNVGTVWFGSEVAAPSYIRSMNVQIDNGPREQTAVGNAALVGVGTGSFNVTGSMEAYFENRTLMDEFSNGTDSFIRFQLTDNDGNIVFLTIPRLRWSDGQVTAGGGNDDVIVSLNFQGFINAGGTHTMQLDML